MRLISLSLQNFRSYASLDLAIDRTQNIVMLLGENATGKTNILEAIGVLAILKSSRKSCDSDLMQWEQSHYRVCGTCESDVGAIIKLEVVSQIEPRKSRAAFVNGVRTPANRYIGTLPIVAFTPDDLLLWTGAPGNRRRLVDSLLCQVSGSYLQALVEHERALKQRNALLKLIREESQERSSLDAWDEKLALLGAVITMDRLRLFEALQQDIIKELRMLGERPQNAVFSYMRKTDCADEQTIRLALLEEFSKERERDILTQTTSTGPHRDDWMLNVDGRDVAVFASRGQQRAALLALLLLQASFLEQRKGEKPVLLFDDVFSEFDDRHRTCVLDALATHQVIMTAVTLEKNLRENANVITCPILQTNSHRGEEERAKGITMIKK